MSLLDASHTVNVKPVVVRSTHSLPYRHMEVNGSVRREAESAKGTTLISTITANEPLGVTAEDTACAIVDSIAANLTLTVVGAAHN
jgi:hypothetical protein